MSLPTIILYQHVYLYIIACLDMTQTCANWLLITDMWVSQKICPCLPSTSLYWSHHLQHCITYWTTLKSGMHCSLLIFTAMTTGLHRTELHYLRKPFHYKICIFMALTPKIQKKSKKNPKKPKKIQKSIKQPQNNMAKKSKNLKKYQKITFFQNSFDFFFLNAGKKCYPISFPILGGCYLTRALHSSPFQNPGGKVRAWRRRSRRTNEQRKSHCPLWKVS